MQLRKFLVGAAALSVFGAGILAFPPSPPRQQGFAIQDLPASRKLVDENILLGLVAAGDWKATRRHSWELWAAMTTPSATTWNRQRLPVWLTWYSATEVFSPGPKPPPDRGRMMHMARPAQIEIANPNVPSVSGSLFGFVKYNRAAAQFIWQNRYHLRKTLDDLQAKFDAEKRPTDERTIKPFPREAVVTKPVFWLVKNAKSPQAQRGLTVLPYWDPAYPPPPGGKTPDHRTWTKCVAIDPGKTRPEGSIETVTLDGRPTPAKVVYLDRFFAIPIRDKSEVEAVKVFASHLSSAGGEQERMITDPANTPEIGDFVILLAMHVTTKEIDNWTFQTFWWLPDANTSPFAADRPASVRGVWRNYVMCNAWSMESPREANGDLHVCFNPYLEADLGPTKPFEFEGQTLPADPMAGTKSNCMNCHNRAGYPAFTSAPWSANMGRVRNDGYRPPNDPYFSKLTKTDFLWSIPLHAAAPPVK